MHFEKIFLTNHLTILQFVAIFIETSYFSFAHSSSIFYEKTIEMCKNALKNVEK